MGRQPERRPDERPQDIDFTRARIETPSEIFSGSKGTSREAWAFLGVAIGIGVCGLAMGVALTTARKREGGGDQGGLNATDGPASMTRVLRGW